MLGGKEMITVTKEKLNKILDAADVICSECWGNENECEFCYVRQICDEAKTEQVEALCHTNPKS